MKKIKVQFVLFLCITLLLSCGNNTNNQPAPGNVDSTLQAEANAPVTDHVNEKQAKEDSGLVGEPLPAENVFTIQNGKIITNQKMITPLYQPDSISAEVPYSTERVFSQDRSLQYQVALYNYEDVIDEETGLFRVIKIRREGKELLKLKQADGWDTIPRIFAKGGSNSFLTIHLDPKLSVLLFVSHNYPSGPGDVTMVALNENEAKMVYNQEMYFTECTNNVNGFEGHLVSWYIAYLDNGKPDMEGLPSKYRIWPENGLLKIQYLGETWKEFETY